MQTTDAVGTDLPVAELRLAVAVALGPLVHRRRRRRGVHARRHRPRHHLQRLQTVKITGFILVADFLGELNRLH